MVLLKVKPLFGKEYTHCIFVGTRPSSEHHCYDWRKRTDEGLTKWVQSKKKISPTFMVVSGSFLVVGLAEFYHVWTTAFGCF